MQVCFPHSSCHGQSSSRPVSRNAYSSIGWRNADIRPVSKEEVHITRSTKQEYFCQQTWSRTQACTNTVCMREREREITFSVFNTCISSTFELMHALSHTTNNYDIKAKRKISRQVFMSDSTFYNSIFYLTPMCYSIPWWCHLSWPLNHFHKLSILSHLSKDLKVQKQAIKSTWD